MMSKTAEMGDARVSYHGSRAGAGLDDNLPSGWFGSRFHRSPYYTCSRLADGNKFQRDCPNGRFRGLRFGTWTLRLSLIAITFTINPTLWECQAKNEEPMRKNAEVSRLGKNRRPWGAHVIRRYCR